MNIAHRYVAIETQSSGLPSAQLCRLLLIRNLTQKATSSIET